MQQLLTAHPQHTRMVRVQWQVGNGVGAGEQERGLLEGPPGFHSSDRWARRREGAAGQWGVLWKREGCGLGLAGGSGVCLVGGCTFS